MERQQIYKHGKYFKNEGVKHKLKKKELSWLL